MRDDATGECQKSLGRALWLLASTVRETNAQHLPVQVHFELGEWKIGLGE